MITISEFKIGDKLEIVLNINDDRGIKQVPLISQIEDYKESILFISIPLINGEPYKLKRNQKVKLIIYREDRGIYSFIGEIVSMEQNHIIMYGIKPISKIQKEQRRYYFRLQNRNKMIIKSREREQVETCYTVDLSGGGTKILCKSDFNKNEKVNCYINIEGEIINVTGEIVRKEKNITNNSNELGIKFININDNDRNKIISYIFKEQRLLRKKGLI